MKKADFLLRLPLLLPAAAFLLYSCASVSEKPLPEPQKEEAAEAVKEAEQEEEEGPSPEELRRQEEEKADRAVEAFVQSGETEKALKIFEKTYAPAEIEEAGDLLLYGLLLLANGDFSRAGEIFQQAAAIEPGNTAVLYNLSIIEGAKGNKEKQQELLEKIIEKSPVHVEAQTSLGSLYLEKKKRKAAKEAFRSAIKEDGAFVPARMGYAAVLLQEEAYAAAEKELGRVIEMDPDYALAYVDRSKSRVAQENRTGAVEDLSKAIELDPGNFWNYLDRGRIRLRLGRIDEALEDFSRAIELNPDNFFPYAYRAGIYDQLDRTDKALEDYERVLELREDYYFAYSSLGTLYYMKSRWIDAALAFGKAFMHEEDMFPYAMFSAACMYRGGLEEDGREYLREVIPSIPKENIYYHLMRLYLDKNYETYFLSKIEDMDDKQLKGEALFFLALFYNLQGQQRLSGIYFLEVTDLASPESIEYRLASWEIGE